MIWAILRAQLLSMRRGKSKSAVFSVLTALFFYSIFAFLGWTFFLLFSSPDASQYFDAILAGLLLLLTLYWQLAPVISASFGASIDLKKLMAYPIPRNQLFIIEILLRAVNAFDVLLLVIGITAGLVRNPLYGLAAAPFVVTGALGFVVMNVLLSAGVRSWLERFFLRTRFKEVFFLILVLISVTPQLLVLSKVKQPQSLLRFVPSHSLWPWAAFSHTMLRESVSNAAAAGFAWIVLVMLFSRWQFERTLRSDGTSTRRVSQREDKPDSLAERIFRFPGRIFGDPLGALIEKELRTLSRIPRFRMAYGMSCFFGILIFTPALRKAKPNSAVLQYALPIMAVYGLMILGQITYWNSLGFDRSAAQGYFSWPVRFRDVLIAKNLTVMALLLPQVILVSLVAHSFGIPSSPLKIVETFVVMAIAALFWFGLGNISSVRMPRAMDPDKMNQMSNKLQALTILAAPIVLLPVVLAYWARSVFQNDWIFAGIMVIAAILGAIFYHVGLDSAVQTAHRTRERMLIELSRSDSPISIT